MNTVTRLDRRDCCPVSRDERGNHTAGLEERGLRSFTEDCADASRLAVARLIHPRWRGTGRPALATERRPKMHRLFPVLPVRLMSESLSFYTEKLGFQVGFGDVSQSEPNYIGLH